MFGDKEEFENLSGLDFAWPFSIIQTLGMIESWFLSSLVRIEIGGIIDNRRTGIGRMSSGGIRVDEVSSGGFENGCSNHINGKGGKTPLSSDVILLYKTMIFAMAFGTLVF